jgi:hypothetical protein
MVLYTYFIVPNWKLDLEYDESKAHKSEGKNFHIGGYRSFIEPSEKCVWCVGNMSFFHEVIQPTFQNLEWE